MLCLIEHTCLRFAYYSNSHFTNDFNFDIIGLRRVEVQVFFATSQLILHLLTSLQLCFADVSPYLLALFYVDISS